MKKLPAALSAVILFTTSVIAADLYVSPEGIEENTGTEKSPLSFGAAIRKAAETLKTDGLPKAGIRIHVLGGHYRFSRPFTLGPEFQGLEESPIVIAAEADAEVVFDGSMRIPPTAFRRLKSLEELKRVPASARDQIIVAELSNPDMIRRFESQLMLNLSYNGDSHLPSVFPNEGYASFEDRTAEPEVCPPGIPVGRQGYGIRAGNPPHQEPGRAQNWRGSLTEPRGAKARIHDKADEMAGTWEQWEKELRRNNKRNQLTGYIEANWLLSSQPVVGADAATRSLHLSRALTYGWAWRKDKPFRVFGMLCELDQPGEWHFDPLTRKLYLYPPEPIRRDSEIALSVADGFLHFDRCAHVQVIGLNVRNVGSGTVYRIDGSNNLVAGCTVRNCTATGVALNGTGNAVKGCNLIDLNKHVALNGGTRSPTEITPGHNAVENCHIYQKEMRHEKVNVAIDGVGNRFANNLVHNSLGQAVVVNGNDHVVELNEFFNVGYDEGDGGAVYSGADMTGYGTVYRYNFFHHLMHVPGKVERSGIHLDDLQAGATCIGNIFYKSAAKGIHMNGGAGHTLKDNIFLEGYRGIYNVAAGGKKGYDRQCAIDANPNHMYKNTKENYIGRAEKIIGPKGWEKSPWKEKYPLMFEVMSDTGVSGRYWPIRCTAENNFYYHNSKDNHTVWSRASAEVMAKNKISNDRNITPDAFVDYDALDFSFKPGRTDLPDIPFKEIGLKLDEYRRAMPDKQHYRKAIRECYRGIPCMPGTKKQIDTAKVVEEGPILVR